MGSLLNGRLIAQELNSMTCEDIIKIKEETDMEPTLAVITAGVGDSLKMHESRLHTELAFRLGIVVKEITFDGSVNESHLMDAIQQCNEDKNIQGIFVLLPLPDHINQEKVLFSISNEKELEGLNENKNSETLFQGKQICILSSVLILLNHVGHDIFNSRNVFLITENILKNNPVVKRLLGLASILKIPLEVITVTRHHFEKIAAQADLLLISLETPECIDERHIKEGAVVIDFNPILVGEKFSEDKTKIIPILKSSLKIDSVVEKAKYIDASSGGIGPITLAILMRNFIYNCKQLL